MVSDVVKGMDESDIIALRELNIRENFKEYMVTMQLYRAGMMEIKTKFEILDEEFSVKYDYNPIHHIESRLKSPQSIIEKLRKRSLPFSVESMKNNIFDIAGIRVICNYKDDINTLSDLLLRQSDITLKYNRDYITQPKENGYRSLHLVVEVPIFLAESTVNVPVEIQIRTIAMDFWASLEHRLKYKTDNEVSAELKHRLMICAEAIAEIDEEMLDINNEIKIGNADGGEDK